MTPQQLTLPELSFGTPTGLWTWPRWRAINFTGSANHRYTHGHATRRRRRVEQLVNTTVPHLMAFRVVALRRKISNLPRSTSRERAEWLLEQLGEYWPARWARPDERRHVRSPRFYIPPRALAVARQWLRWWRELQRLVLLFASLITGPTPLPTTGGREESSVGALETRKQQTRTALEAYRDHCDRTGLAWHTS